ncbi:MAG: hypothetical protein P8J27_05555 [Mariniblastus sp.]|nr:hypothetical protein [Mariniblastus sp.]
MSICFLVISVMVGASHRNWKQIATDMQNDAKAAATRLTDAKNSNDEKEKLLQSERVSRALQLSQLESQLNRANDDLDLKEEQYLKSTEISQARLAELEQVTNRIKQQDQEILALKSNNTKLVDDIATQFSLVRNLTNTTYEQQNKIDLLEEKEGDIRADLAKSQRVLKANGLTPNQLTAHIVPKLDGVVTTVGSNGLFAVGLGSDDGLRVDHVMDIYRNDRFVGKGTVVTAKDNLSVLRVQADFMKDSVREGDHVTSKF